MKDLCPINQAKGQDPENCDASALNGYNVGAPCSCCGSEPATAHAGA